MFHAAAVPISHVAPLRSGQVSYTMRRFELEPFLGNIEKFQITDVGIVPPIAVMMIMSPVTKKYSLKSLKVAQCGAAPLGKETQKRFYDLMDPGSSFSQVWGMTEATCAATLFYYPERDTTASVGRFIPNIDVKYALIFPFVSLYPPSPLIIPSQNQNHR
jgi:acyl-CoA synthetase (AMP-forming)/AMP-acid ligase II